MTVDALALAQSLIRCASIAPDDAGAQAVVRAALEPLGFACHELPFGAVKNLFARLGTAGPHFCFAGHTDVVPAGDAAAWTYPPFGGMVADGRLYGRGAADMKGAIACFAAAVAGFLEENGPPAGSISFLITGDEEGPAVDGTERVLGWMRENGHIPDVALVGEPTNPDVLGQEVKIGRRGSLNGVLTVPGTQGHVAYPERADNPVPRALALFQSLAAHEFDQGTAHFQPTNLEITAVDTGNQTTNVIPAAITARFNVRFSDRWTTRASLEDEIRRVLDATGTVYEVQFSGNAVSFVTPPGALTDVLQAAVQDATGRVPALTTHGGTSDARFITQYCPVVEFGLLNETIHQIDEQVALSDLDDLTRIYQTVLERFFRSPL